MAAWSWTSRPPWSRPSISRATGRTAAGMARMPVSARCRCCSSAPRSRSSKYLPKLASVEMIGAYCLTEPHAGLGRAGRAHPRRSLARRHALHPQRPEDVDHQRRRGRSVHGLRQNRRREVHGVSGRARVPRREHVAPKKRRWGSRAAPRPRSTSTTCAVPVENVLGEIGRGHIIAFNILNIGRLKLGPFAVGGSKNVLAASLEVRQGAESVRLDASRSSA